MRKVAGIIVLVVSTMAAMACSISANPGSPLPGAGNLGYVTNDNVTVVGHKGETSRDVFEIVSTGADQFSVPGYPDCGVGYIYQLVPGQSSGGFSPRSPVKVDIAIGDEAIVGTFKCSQTVVVEGSAGKKTILVNILLTVLP